MLNFHTMPININYRLLFFAFLFTGFIVNSVIVQADFEAGAAANQQGDRATAFREFQAAAFEHDARAYGKLASMYLYGLGTKKDFTLAYVWFELSYLAGDRYAERFRDAASAMMTRTEYLQAMDLVEKQRSELGLEIKPGLETKLNVQGHQPEKSR